MKVRFGYDKYMNKSLIECFYIKCKKVVIMHLLGFSVFIKLN